MHSLTIRRVGPWSLSTKARVGRAEAIVARACGLILDRCLHYATSRCQTVKQQASRDEQSVDHQAISSIQTLLPHDFALPGPIGNLTACCDADGMALRGARADRLAALGHMAASVAQAICNPIAVARPQDEDAQAGDDARRRATIGDLPGQIDRLDGLARSAGSNTHCSRPTWSPSGRLTDASDRNPVGAWPKSGIFDPQPGPDRSGRPW